MISPWQSIFHAVPTDVPDATVPGYGVTKGNP